MHISFEILVTWIITVVTIVGAYLLGKADAWRLKKTDEEAVGKPISSDDWEWPVWEKDSYSGRFILQRDVHKPKSAPFEVYYNRARDLPDQVRVKLCSKALIKVARECLPKHLEKLVTSQPSVFGTHLYIALESFNRSYQSMLKEDTSLDVQHHLKHLIRFLETEYAGTKALEESIPEDRVHWDQLWVFIHKGETVYYTCSHTDQKLLGIVRGACYYDYRDRPERSFERFFRVDLECCTFNGRKYVRDLVQIKIDEFMTADSFESIGIGPMSLLEQSKRDELHKMFLSNGIWYHHIVSRCNRYMQYEGPRIRKERNRISGLVELTKYNADGRVMVDLLSFARHEPGYPLGNATPWVCGIPHTRVHADTETPSDDDLMLAPAIVYGFSFANKQWGAFDIHGLSEITFNDKAYDCDLVLSDPSRKKMLLDLVSEYLTNLSDGNNNNLPKLDPISNKGDGCIFLCYGPPGTGKTLTAESIAEKLHHPLWAMNVFELGRTSKDLEMNLMQILEIASRWRAVLLLDEADIYMEKRTQNGDPERTAMTSIFLRLIEYYRGVLFLTTNRVASFDVAFCSRISIFLRYYRLDGVQCMAVWSNLLARAGIENPDPTPFTETELNGREIRNTVRMAQTWAKSSKEKLTTDHVVEMVKMVGEFRQDLEGAILEEFEEQTITQALARVRSMKCRPDTAQPNDN